MTRVKIFEHAIHYAEWVNDYNGSMGEIEIISVIRYPQDGIEGIVVTYRYKEE